MNSLSNKLPPLWDVRALRAYLGALNDRHSQVDSLALPNMRDMSPLRLRELFVNPQLAEKYASAATNPKEWPEGMGLFAALEKWPRLVVLGDPGAGKTTLSSWLAWRLSAGMVAKLPESLDERLPICCVLREMPQEMFSAAIDIAELANWSAKRVLGAKFDENLAQQMRPWVEAGRYVLILDGVDEVSREHRVRVRVWMQEANKANATVLATSRIVGYGDMPVHCVREKEIFGEFPPDSPLAQVRAQSQKDMREFIRKLGAAKNEDESAADNSGDTILTSWAQTLYLLPFDEKRIAAFTSNWYQQRCPNEEDAQQSTASLLAALANSDATQVLARTPNLLSLMAIVHRERGYLPSGKALLYKEIANAYINTIDTQRKIVHGDVLSRYTLEVRESWLAYIAFQMQKLRVENYLENDAGVLVEKTTVEQWLSEAMRKSNLPEAEKHAGEFLSWVARRSGLLLPRSENLYGFVHLSFQEYFSARYLLAQITSPAFMRDKHEKISKEKLQEWTENNLWQESLLYLLELTSNERADWLEEVLQCLFGEVSDFDDSDQMRLALRIVNDQHIICSPAWQESLVHASAKILPNFLRGLGEGLALAGYGLVINTPTTAGQPTAKLLASLDQPEKILCVYAAGSALSDLAFLAPMRQLRYLYLNDTAVHELQVLATLAQLQRLELAGTAVQDISALQSLRDLQFLDLRETKVSELSGLAKLQQLTTLYLDQCPLSDISVLAHLAALQVLTLTATPVQDLSPLANLQDLEGLDLGWTEVTDFSPLAKSASLRRLAIAHTKVPTLAPLATTPILSVLYLSESQRALGEELQTLRPNLGIHYS